MPILPSRRTPRIAALVAVWLIAAPALAAGPFEGLAGSWTGVGSAALSNGGVLRLRCQAVYEVAGGGDTLEQDLRCASERESFDFHIELSQEAGGFVGNWRETIRQVQGGVSGHGANGTYQATVRGQAFSAEVAVTTHGAQQSVIIRGQGGGLSTISMQLRRSR